MDETNSSNRYVSVQAIQYGLGGILNLMIQDIGDSSHSGALAQTIFLYDPFHGRSIELGKSGLVRTFSDIL